MICLHQLAISPTHRRGWFAHFHALERAGVEVGDTVQIGEWETEWGLVRVATLGHAKRLDLAGAQAQRHAAVR
jgi:hypothetical protein